MIDTIRIFTYEFKLNKDHEFKQGATYYKDSVSLNNLYCKTEISYFKIDHSRLFYQTSLPKLLHGTNIKEIYENDKDIILQKIKDEFDYVGLTIVNNNFNDFKISRLDICKNIEVEHPIYKYIWALSLLEYPRCKKMQHENETITFFNSQRTFQLYNKQKQFKDTNKNPILGILYHNNLENTLRLESRLLKSSVVNSTFKGIDLKLVDLFNKQLVNNHLLNEFKKLKGFNDIKILDQPLSKFENDIFILDELHKKKSRNEIKDFLAIRNAQQFLKDYNHDRSKIKELFKPYKESRQIERILNEIFSYEKKLIAFDKNTKNKYNLLNEIKEKLIA